MKALWSRRQQKSCLSIAVSVDSTLMLDWIALTMAHIRCQQQPKKEMIVLVEY